MPIEQLLMTDRKRGAGVDPELAGYQIAACSPTLDPQARDLLPSMCVQYGNAVYSEAPAAARERETDWRKQTDRLDAVPAEVLDEFPVVWSYDKVRDDLFALTQVRYAGLTHDERFGAFLAHALVFPPDALAAHDFNPLTLRHSDLFLSRDQPGCTSLPSLADLDGVPAASPDFALLTDDRFREHLAALVAALAATSGGGRRLLVCLKDWRQAAPFVEALLALLPPSIRCRTTVGTFDSHRCDRRRSGPGAAHQLVVFCDGDDPTFGLQADDYRSHFAVFNFVADRFSECEPPGRFAAFAAACGLHGRVEALQRFQALLERLGFGAIPATWDSLAAAACLFEEQPRPEDLAEAARGPSALLTEPRQIETLLELFAPPLRRLAETNDLQGLKTTATAVTALVGRLPAATDTDVLPNALEAIRALTRDMLAQGKADAAGVLLNVFGPRRERILSVLLAEVCRNSSPPSESERRPLLELVLEGIAFARKNPKEGPDPAGLLLTAFRTATADDIAAVWNRLGDEMVLPRLEGPWEASKRQWLRDMLACLPVECCPEANVLLNLKLLETSPPKGDELMTALRRIAEACGRCPDTSRATSETLRSVAQRLEDKTQRAIALGRMAEAAAGSSAGEKFYEGYREARSEGKSAEEVRRKLASAGAGTILCRELLDEVLPWNETEGPKKVRHWRKDVAGDRPELLGRLYQQVAVLLTGSGPSRGASSLADQLVLERPEKVTANGSWLELCAAVLLARPLQPLPPEWDKALSAGLDRLPDRAAARLKLLRWMTEVHAASQKRDWSLAALPHDDRAWKNAVRELSPDENALFIAWSLDCCATTGITTAAEAMALVQWLAAVGVEEDRHVADAVEHLLRDRDPVTRVLVAMAFARAILEGSREPRRWGGIVRMILERFDQATRRLFAEHLEKRFCRSDTEYDQRLEQFRAAAGLEPLPRFSPAVTSASSAPRKAGRLAGLVGWLCGRSKSADGSS